MTLVLDASVVSTALLADRFDVLDDAEPVAPPLVRSEVASALHRAAWQGTIAADQAAAALRALDDAPISIRNPRRLSDEAWRIADAFGWARTYDAEYVAPASLPGCRLVTLDGRLRRGTERLGFVVLPGEL